MEVGDGRVQPDVDQGVEVGVGLAGGAAEGERAADDGGERAAQRGREGLAGGGQGAGLLGGGSARVVPVVGPDYAGLSASGAF